MGGIGRTIFGGPEKKKEESGNHAYNEINSAFSPNFSFTSNAGSALSNLLGLDGAPAQTGALENFANSGGMQFLRDQGNRQITSNQAAKGLLNSGATLKALDKYGQNLGSTYLSQYMTNLGSLANIGLSSGALVSDAGKYSKGSAEGAKKGILPMAAQLAAAGA